MVNQSELDPYEVVRKYYNYKIDSYESKYKRGLITHLHTGIFSAELPQSLPSSPEEIQSLLIDGQRKLTEKIGGYIPDHVRSILDIGCGHGGTIFSLASMVEAKIHGITISDEQAELVMRRTNEQSLDHRIEVLLGNILNYDFAQKKFDVLLGVESFCQIGNMKTLAKVINHIQRPGGLVIISDYYSDDQQFKEYFDKHWRCDVKSKSDLHQYMVDAKYTIVAEEDLTLGSGTILENQQCA